MTLSDPFPLLNVGRMQDTLAKASIDAVMHYMPTPEQPNYVSLVRKGVFSGAQSRALDVLLGKHPQTPYISPIKPGTSPRPSYLPGIDKPQLQPHSYMTPDVALAQETVFPITAYSNKIVVFDPAQAYQKAA